MSRGVVVARRVDAPERALRRRQHDPVQRHGQRELDVGSGPADAAPLEEGVGDVEGAPRVQQRRPEEAVVIGAPLAAWANLRDRVWEDTTEERDVARGT